MKKVEFVRVKSELCGFGLGKGTRNRFEKAEEIVKERMESGWTFVGYLPMETRGAGELETISLIFQREESPAGVSFCDKLDDQQRE